MDRVRLFVLTCLYIDREGKVASRNVGATFSLPEAELHKAECIEHDFETLLVDARWPEDAAKTDVVFAMRDFGELVREMQDAALR